MDKKPVHFSYHLPHCIIFCSKGRVGRFFLWNFRIFSPSPFWSVQVLTLSMETQCFEPFEPRLVIFAPNNLQSGIWNLKVSTFSFRKFVSIAIITKVIVLINGWETHSADYSHLPPWIETALVCHNLEFFNLWTPWNYLTFAKHALVFAFLFNRS